MFVLSKKYSFCIKIKYSISLNKKVVRKNSQKTVTFTYIAFSSKKQNFVDILVFIPQRKFYNKIQKKSK